LPVLVILPRCFRFPLESSLGTAPLYPINCRALSNLETWPNSDTIVTAEISAMPRNACNPLINSCTCGDASFTASVTKAVEEQLHRAGDHSPP
jgi:hypothetical protein